MGKRTIDNSTLRTFKAIGTVQSIIANATTLDEALRESLKSIVEQAGADGGAICFAVE